MRILQIFSGTIGQRDHDPSAYVKTHSNRGSPQAPPLSRYPWWRHRTSVRFWRTRRLDSWEKVVRSLASSGSVYAATWSERRFTPGSERRSAPVGQYQRGAEPSYRASDSTLNSDSSCLTPLDTAPRTGQKNMCSGSSCRFHHSSDPKAVGTGSVGWE